MTDQLAQLTPGTWTIDAGHTTAGFTARHMMITKVRGRFGGVSGQVTIPDVGTDAVVEATIDVASVDTGDAGRDEHLRSADFFDVATFPTMTFRSTAVKVEGDEVRLSGDLTIKDVTRPVELDVEFDGAGADPWGGTRAGFSASATVNRKDWGLTWNVALESGGVLVSDKITLNLDVQLVKAEA